MTATDWSDPSLTGERPDAKIPRDRWGRYRIPHPDTGKVQSWTRVTTMAGTLADRFALEQWSKRNVVLGLGARSDLYAQAAAATPDQKDLLNGIVAAAEEASKAKAGANLGTALHRFTERLDAGEQITVPDPWARDVAAYREVMAAAGVAIVDGWLERVLLIPQVGCAGTVDRLANAMEWTLPRIGDLKSGQDVVTYGMTEIAIQLSLYSRATHWFDPATRRLHEMPKVDQDRALVMHVPVGQGVCSLYEVDIAAGWEAVQLAVAVREWRKRKDLAQQLPVVGSPSSSQVRTPDFHSGNAGSSPVGDTTSPLASDDRVAWLRQRIEAIKAAGHVDELALTWPVGVPTLKQGGLDDLDIDAIVRACVNVERAHRIEFPGDDPLFAVFDQNPPVALEQAATAARIPEPTAQEWADRARGLLAPLEDEALAETIAECAGAKAQKMTRRLHDNVAAIVTQLNDTANGVIALEIDENDGSRRLVVADSARDRLSAVHGNEIAALAAAKQHAKALGLSAPRSLKSVVEQPLLAALTAAGKQQ